MTRHAGQMKILPSIAHEAATRIKALVANVRHGLCLIQETAPQLDSHQRCFAVVRSVRYLVARIWAYGPKPNPGLTACATGQLRKTGLFGLANGRPGGS